MNTHARNLIRKLLHSSILLVFFCSGLGHSPVAHAQALNAPNPNPKISGSITQVADSILLVDDDNDSPDVNSYYTTALTNLGYSARTFTGNSADAVSKKYVIWNTNGTLDNEPDYNYLEHFAIVIWFSGGNNNSDGTSGPDAVGTAGLTSWLGSGPGGCFFLSSQDYYTDNHQKPFWGPFATTYLGVGSVTPDVILGPVTGAGDIFGGMGPYEFTFPDGMQNVSDSVNYSDTSRTAFTSLEGDAGVYKHYNSFRTAYIGFPLEFIPAAAGKQVLANFIGWCEQTPQTLTVTISPAGTGSGNVTSDPPGINCGSSGTTCTHAFPYNYIVTLTATADFSDVFAGWTGDCTGSTCTLGMKSARSVTATFDSPQNTIYVMDVLAMDSQYSGSSQGITQFLPSGDLQAASLKTNFYAGDPMWLAIKINNQVSYNQTATFQWTVLDTGGEPLIGFDSTSNISPIPVGISYPWISNTIPADTTPGDYTFYGSCSYGGKLTSDRITIHIDPPPHRIYLPMILK